MWKDNYQEKKKQPEQLKNLIHPGFRVYVETGCTEPRYLVEKLILNNEKLSDVEIFTSIPISDFSDFGGKYGSRFRIKSFFISPSISTAFTEGNADHMPLSTTGLTRLFMQNYVHINVALIQLGPPDSQGFMSMGVTVDITRTVIDKADIVIAQINGKMPRTFGDGFINIDKIDYLVEYDDDLIEFPQNDHDPEIKQIGKNIAGLIEDGSTIQLGFGRIPDAALKALDGKKDIGIHSEIITDSVCELVEKGVITNELKTMDKGKTIASLCLGTKQIFDFVHDNPGVMLKSPEYTSNPQVFLGHKNLVAINGAVEIDLTGQSCNALSDKGHSGPLSHADFNRSAMLTEGGKGIIALRSTSRDGKHSRIVPKFTDSQIGIITTRADINYVVTEYGHADLFGKSIRDRALALISIAHPRFRDFLIEEAKKLNYIYQDQVIPPEYSLYPSQYELRKTIREKDLFIRPIKITDERGLQDLFYAMSQDDKFYRFLMNVTALHHQQAQPLVNADYKNSMALVVQEYKERETDIIAISHIAREDYDDRNACEFAVMVHPAWQNMGIGSFLFSYMLDIANKLGFRKMNAHVWEDNMRMLKVFEKSGLITKRHLEDRVCTVSMATFPL